MNIQNTDIYHFRLKGLSRHFTFTYTEINEKMEQIKTEENYKDFSLNFGKILTIKDWDSAAIYKCGENVSFREHERKIFKIELNSEDFHVSYKENKDISGKLYQLLEWRLNYQPHDYSYLHIQTWDNETFYIWVKYFDNNKYKSEMTSESSIVKLDNDSILKYNHLRYLVKQMESVKDSYKNKLNS